MTVKEFFDMCEVEEWYNINIWKDGNRIFRGDCLEEISNTILLERVKSFNVSFSCCDELLLINITLEG